LKYFYSGITSTKELSEFEDLKIFPNPAASLINLTGEALSNEKNMVQIINSQGMIIFSGRVNGPQINVEHLSSGLYQIVLRNNNSKFKGRFLKI
jgi:hypothetical protein